MVGAKVPQAALDFLADGSRPEVLVDLLIDGPQRGALVVGVEVQQALFAVPDQAALGGQNDAVAAVVDRPADDLFAVSVAVDRSGVDEIDAVVQGGVDGGDRLFVIRPAPHPGAGDPAPKPTAEISIPDEPSFRICMI